MYNTNDIQYAHHCLLWGCKKTFGDVPPEPPRKSDPAGDESASTCQASKILSRSSGITAE